MSGFRGKADVLADPTESPSLAEVVEKGTAEAIFRCPLIEGADISLPPQFLLRRLGALGS
jgi:hypothetical protein